MWAFEQLRTCANRLHKPGLSIAFGQWTRVWQAYKEKQLMEARQNTELDVVNMRHKSEWLEGQLNLVKSELHEVKDSAASHSAQAPGRSVLHAPLSSYCIARGTDTTGLCVPQVKEEREKLRVELTVLDGGRAETERKHQEALERQRLERLELLHKQSARRIMNRDLADGWLAWKELYDARTYAFQRLRQVAGRLRTPGLAWAFSGWCEPGSHTHPMRSSHCAFGAQCPARAALHRARAAGSSTGRPSCASRRSSRSGGAPICSRPRRRGCRPSWRRCRRSARRSCTRRTSGARRCSRRSRCSRARCRSRRASSPPRTRRRARSASSCSRGRSRGA